MSQTLSDWLSIDQIARFWARETDNAGFGAEDIADDLVTAAESGEFEHPAHSREDAPRGKLTYKETREDGTVETKETEQSGVGPYGSPLRMRDGRRVNSIDIVNYIKARQTAPGATDRETRRIVARDIFLSVEGFRRWCDEPEFAEWAQLRGLSRPKFIDHVIGDGAGQAPETRKEKRARQGEQDAPQAHDAQPSTLAKADQTQTYDELKDWFVNVYVPAHKDESPNPTRDAALSAAKPEFAKYCDQTHLRGDLRKIWRSHAPGGWKRTGPRAKTE